MKWVIVLRSKHTGESTHLGSEYETPAEALAYAQENVCTRCNSYDITPRQDEAEWINRHEGFRVRA